MAPLPVFVLLPLVLSLAACSEAPARRTQANDTSPAQDVMVADQSAADRSIADRALVDLGHDMDAAGVDALAVDAPAVDAPASGIVPNSIDVIWDDVHSPNTVWTSQTASMQQFLGALVRDFPTLGPYAVNAWYEIEEEGDGSTCSSSVSKATNTRVEVGRIRGWILYKNRPWLKFVDVNSKEGTRMPASSDPFGATNFRLCGKTYDPLRKLYPKYRPELDSNGKYVVSPQGFYTYKPLHYWVWHGWGGSHHVINKSTGHKAVFIQIYMRLVVENPAKKNDLALARYVAHVGSDIKEPDGKTKYGAIGISKHKRVTTAWQPFNLITGGITKAELIANPPPFVSKP